MNFKPLLLAILVLGQHPLFSQLDSIQRVVDYYSKEHNFNGAVLVSKSGHLDYVKGIGLANRQHDVPISASTRFRIASITKTFTAILAMQLVDEGKLDLQGKIHKYLPSYRGEGGGKTSIYNLLTYSSGIPNCEHKYGDTIYKTQLPADVFISRYCSDPLETTPGTTFNYDNGDYVILGRILESITGKRFKELLTEKILRPAEMANTGMLTNDMIVPGLAASYLFDDSTKAFSNDPPYYIENFFSAGAMYSTVEDLFRFDQAIFNGKLLSAKGLATLLTADTSLGNVALGFWKATSYPPIDTTFYYRPGGIYGSTANWIHVINPQITLIVCSNSNATNLVEMSQKLYVAVSGKPTQLSPTRPLPKRNSR